MASLLDLPEEILIIIIKHLDIKSVYNLYRSCGTLQNIILMQGVIRICNLSCNTLATQKSLQLDMIKRISGQLYELNMRGVSNLKKSGLLPALRRMKCLRTLDVSFTEITILDLFDIHTACSTIKNIAINFSNDVAFPGKTIIDSFEELFKNFDNIHFVLYTMYSIFALCILRKCSLDTLKLTLCGAISKHNMFIDIDLCPIRHLCIFISNSSEHVNTCQGTWNMIVPPLKMENIEYIIFEYLNAAYTVCVSPVFTNFFSECFKTTPVANFHQERFLCGTVAIFIWDKKRTTFDEHFFITLKRKVKKILVREITVPSEHSLISGDDVISYDCFHITQMGTIKNIRADTEPKLKKIRIGSSDQVLDYDKIFNEHKSVKLRVHFPDSVNATLSPRNNYLSKITYLSLTGSYVRYSNEFFNVLFRSCNMLITLNVVASSLSSSCSSITRSLPLTRSLKNLRLEDKRIDFRTLFSSFTQCRTLENIWIVDSSSETNGLANLTALYQCKNLFSLRIHAVVTKTTLTQMNIMNKTLLKSRPDHYVNFHLDNCNRFHICPYNPYLEVFNLDPIKPVYF